jgi:single-stranded DNA-binding protein
MQAIVHCVGRVKTVTDLRYSDSGSPYLGFSFVQTSGFGEHIHFDWYRATLFGKQAEALAGKLVANETRFYLVGRQRVKLYDRDDGTTGYNVEVTVMHFEFVGDKPHVGGDEEGRPPRKPAGRENKSKAGDGEDVGF